VKEGQEADFRVDAYPDQTFAGRVQQVRLQPTTVQNVVTYNAILAVDNPGQRLMPGMTATISIVVRRANDVLRIPASALRFRPEGFDASRRQRAGQEGGTAAAAGPGSRPQRAGGFRGAEGGRAGGPGQWGRAGGGDGQGSTRPSLVFVLNEKGEPQAARVRLGISDGQFVEVREGLDQGARVVTGTQADTPTAPGARPGASAGANNPFSPQRPPPRQR
jgi:HlyD family secretion protein